MANKATSLSSSSVPLVVEDEKELVFGSKSGSVETSTYCDHLATALSSDLTHIPPPDTHCTRCHHPNENWLCLCCKDVLCSRFINKHMLEHYQETTTHCVALSYSNLSVWCFSCDAYLDAQVILSLRPVYETAYLLKFGKAPRVRLVEYCDHLTTALSSDLTNIPTPDTHCTRCHHPNENWLCLCCKDVLCSRFINKHMLEHYQETTTHCVVLSYSDLSVWCFSCDSYLDPRVTWPVRHVYRTAYLLKFGEAPQAPRLVEYCDHLATALSSDLTHIPTPDTHCTRCHHPHGNYLCLCCKDVLCSRFINKHMLGHYRETTTHCVSLSYSDLSVWCYLCNEFLDAQVILPLRPVYETAYLLKFGEAPPVQSVRSNSSRFWKTKRKVKKNQDLQKVNQFLHEEYEEQREEMEHEFRVKMEEWKKKEEWFVMKINLMNQKMNDIEDHSTLKREEWKNKEAWNALEMEEVEAKNVGLKLKMEEMEANNVGLKLKMEEMEVKNMGLKLKMEEMETRNDGLVKRSKAMREEIEYANLKVKLLIAMVVALVGIGIVFFGGQGMWKNNIWALP